MPFIGPDDMIHGEPVPGWRGRFFHAQNMTFAHYEIDEGAPDLHAHHHEQEEVWNVIEGQVALAVGDDERTLGPGDVAIVPPGSSHSVRILGACKVVVVDYPRRDELPRGIGRS